MAAAQTNEQIRFEPDEACPPLLAIGVALQIVIVMLAGAIMITAIIVRAGGQSDTYLSWAIFMVLVTSGVATILQAVRIKGIVAIDVERGRRIEKRRDTHRIGGV